MRQSHFKPQERRGMALFLYQRKRRKERCQRITAMRQTKAALSKRRSLLKTIPARL
uniref:Uncharacterized protein n=1 Tax=Myoviridae sp. ctxbQ4 TaxID=2827292 RepID=A0A8S5R5Z5_9CAUD|nr:MAG TPA: hypothetical protein [Myoviridae sp. ctxbQ4]